MKKVAYITVPVEINFDYKPSEMPFIDVIDVSLRELDITCRFTPREIEMLEGSILDQIQGNTPMNIVMVER